MSRRPPNPAADRAAQNQQTLKSLVKLEGNKSCADCKRNKHPRWASWNLGVFICIRCSGIHRGMGTHVSRVKSVDLDAWTDEQLKSVLQWGNTRANKYWEAKLAPGHIPSEAKIENFIRTKYESKRWVMDGPMPDPATLDGDGDEDVVGASGATSSDASPDTIKPLGVVQDKQKIDAQKLARPFASSAGQPPPVSKTPQNVDLLGSQPTPAPSQPSAAVSAPQAPPSAPVEQAKPPKPADTLLGLDFLGGPASTGPNAGQGSRNASGSRVSSSSSSRPDLKQSILSLYAASGPRQTPPAQPPHAGQPTFSGGTAATVGQQPQKAAFGGLSDAFSGLSFANTTASPNSQSGARNASASALGTLQKGKASPAAPQLTSPASSGGGMFDSRTSNSPALTGGMNTRNPAASSHDFNLIGSAASAPISPRPSAPAIPAQPPTAGTGLNSLLDFAPAPPPVPEKPRPSSQLPAAEQAPAASVFNLSAPRQTVAALASSASAAAALPKAPLNSGWHQPDPWAQSDEWKPANSPTTTTTTTTHEKFSPITLPSASANDSGGWGNEGLASFGMATQQQQRQQQLGSGSAVPHVSADEDFGGWSSAVPEPPPPRPSERLPPPPPSSAAAAAAPASKGAGGFGGEDLFSNVWE